MSFATNIAALDTPIGAGAGHPSHRLSDWTKWPCLTRHAQAIYMRERVPDERNALANHLTPTELADEVDMQRQEVIARCVQMGIPILHGRIDKTLFVTSLRQLAQRAEQRPA
jgi:hypothetical protein